MRKVWALTLAGLVAWVVAACSGPDEGEADGARPAVASEVELGSEAPVAVTPQDGEGLPVDEPTDEVEPGTAEPLWPVDPLQPLRRLDSAGSFDLPEAVVDEHGHTLPGTVLPVGEWASRLHNPLYAFGGDSSPTVDRFRVASVEPTTVPDWINEPYKSDITHAVAVTVEWEFVALSRTARGGNYRPGDFGSWDFFIVRETETDLYGAWGGSWPVTHWETEDCNNPNPYEWLPETAGDFFRACVNLGFPSGESNTGETTAFAVAWPMWFKLDEDNEGSGRIFWVDPLFLPR